MQSFDAQTLEVTLLGKDPLARRGLASALSLEAILVSNENSATGGLLDPARQVNAVIWDDGPLGNEAPPGPRAPDSLPSPFDPPWIALTTNGDRARELLQRGFRGVLKREVAPASLAAAVEAVVRGLVVTDPDFLHAPPPTLIRDETLHLSPREYEVLALLAEGLSNKEIAAELKLSPHTAKFHVTALLDKFGAQTRTEAVVRAARAGLLTL